MSIGGPPGPGWWQATDGRWYAPESHPAAQAPPPPFGLPPAGGPPPPQGPPPRPTGWADPQAQPGPGDPPAQPGPGYPPGHGYGYGYAPPTAKKMPTWAIVLICCGGGLFVLAILLAIAIPTFIGVSNNAADRSAQASLNSGLTDAKAVYAADQSFPADTAYQLGRNDPALQFVSATTPTTSPGTISVATVPQAILMTNRSDAGTCWWALVVATAPAGVGAGLPSVPGIYYHQSTGASCQASDFPTAGWQSNSYPTP